MPDPATTEGLTIVATGDGYAVVEKPAGLLSVPGRGPDAVDSVETRAKAMFPEATGPITVHRLDMATSGLMVVGLNRDAHRLLSNQFMKRKVGKTYVAIVDGVPEHDEGAIDLPLIVDWPNRPRQMVCYERGKPSRTLYRVKERLDDGTTRIEFRPVTGRTHQLRMHASVPRDQGGMGCPVLGDRLYGDPTRAPRLLLHANHLAFWTLDGAAWVKYSSVVPF